jgi:hypothetical protein
MPSAEFQRIVRDMSTLGDTCVIAVNKEGVRFSVKGDLGTGNVIRKASSAGEKEDEHTTIEMGETTELTFALRYLNFFTKVRQSARRTRSPHRAAQICTFGHRHLTFSRFPTSSSPSHPLRRPPRCRAL